MNNHMVLIKAFLYDWKISVVKISFHHIWVKSIITSTVVKLTVNNEEK